MGNINATHSPSPVICEVFLAARFSAASASCMALPLLNAMVRRRRPAHSPPPAPRRMFAICNNLGLLPGQFFPANAAGRDYAALALSQSAAGLPQRLHRVQRRVASQRGWRTPGGHLFPDRSPAPGAAARSATPSRSTSTSPNSIGTADAVPLAHARRQHGGPQPLVDRHRRRHPARGQGRRRVQASSSFRARPKRSTHRSGTRHRPVSILDAVAGQARNLQRSVGPADRARLDQYFTSVRDLEHRLQESAGWERQTQAGGQGTRAASTPPARAQYMDKVQIMYDLVRLAFETDSTRAITLMLDSVSTPGRRDHRARPSATAITTSRTTGNPRQSWRSSRSSTTGT